METERSFLKDETPNQNQKTFPSFLRREGVGGGTQEIGRFFGFGNKRQLVSRGVVRITTRAERTEKYKATTRSARAKHAISHFVTERKLEQRI